MNEEKSFCYAICTFIICFTAIIITVIVTYHYCEYLTATEAMKNGYTQQAVEGSSGVHWVKVIE